MTNAEMAAEISRLQAENARIRGTQGRGFSLKVSEKGAVSAYGIGKWPASYYASQWLILLDHEKEIRQFLADHANELSVKGE